MAAHRQTYIHTTSANAVTLAWGLLRLAPKIAQVVTPYLASYPGRVGGEKQSGIDCLHMCYHFYYIFVNCNVHIA